MLLCISRSSNFYYLTRALMCVVIVMNYVQQATSNEAQNSNKVFNDSVNCNQFNNSMDYNLNIEARNCKCDEMCTYYEDCCEDSPFKNSFRHESKTFECVRTMIDGYVYMITSCLSSGRSYPEVVVQNCNDPNTEMSTLDIFLSTPVTNDKTNKTYKNVFCALCNEEADFKFWDILVSYDELLDAVSNATIPSADVILDRIQPNKEEFYWKFTYENTGMQNKVCYLNGTIPESLSSFVRPCKPSKSSARPPNWKYEKNELIQESLNDNFASTNGENKSHNKESCVKLCNSSMGDSIEICPVTEMPKPDTTIYKAYIVDIRDPRIIKMPRSCQLIPQSFPASEGLCPVPLIERFPCFPMNRKLSPPKPCLVNLLLPINDSRLKFVDNGTSIVFDITKYSLSNEGIIISDNMIYICGTYINYPPYEQFILDIDDIARHVLIKISIVFLLLQLLAFILLPELRNLPGKNLASLSLTLLITFTSLELGPILRNWAKTCRPTAIVLHYSILSCFSWMLIMSYDCWLTLYRATTQFRTSAGKGHTSRFVSYCVVCWTLPISPVGFGVYLEFFSNDDNICHLQPGYGITEDCVILNGRYLLLIPASAICFLDVLFFSHSAYMIYQCQRNSVNPNSMNIFKIYTRLAVIMGMAWTLGWLESITGSLILRLMVTVMTTSQGILIFFGFTYKKKYMYALLNKIYPTHTFHPTMIHLAQHRTSHKNFQHFQDTLDTAAKQASAAFPGIHLPGTDYKNLFRSFNPSCHGINTGKTNFVASKRVSSQGCSRTDP